MGKQSSHWRSEGWEGRWRGSMLSGGKLETPDCSPRPLSRSVKYPGHISNQFQTTSSLALPPLPLLATEDTLDLSGSLPSGLGGTEYRCS